MTNLVKSVKIKHLSTMHFQFYIVISEVVHWKFGWAIGNPIKQMLPTYVTLAHVFFSLLPLSILTVSDSII